MRFLLDLLPRFADKTGSAGAIVAAMGCASCFPAIASLGAAVGLGFLAQWEGLFINTLLPVFAVIAAAAQVLSWWNHRRVNRLLIGLAGPAMVLATLYLFWTDDWSTYLFYAGLAVMFAASVWDLVSPPSKECASCEVPSAAADRPLGGRTP
jgi:mercuric ion transport protein